MKVINYGDADWLIGDDAADLLLDYSILMARGGTADSVEMTVIGADVEPTSVTFLLGPATMMTARAVTTDIHEPDNAAAIAEVRARMETIMSPPTVKPAEPTDFIDEYDL